MLNECSSNIIMQKKAYLKIATFLKRAFSSPIAYPRACFPWASKWIIEACVAYHITN